MSLLIRLNLVYSSRNYLVMTDFKLLRNGVNQIGVTGPAMAYGSSWYNPANHAENPPQAAIDPYDGVYGWPYWTAYHSQSETPKSWWAVEIPDMVSFDAYSITPRLDGTDDFLTSFTLDASIDNGASWTRIDTQTNTTGWVKAARIFSLNYNLGKTISGTLAEVLPATKFIARAVSVNTGLMVGAAVFTGGTFTIETAYTGAVYVTVSVMFRLWTPSTYYAVGDVVCPVDFVNVPYYFKRVAAGTSGATAPANGSWPTPGSPNDGTWELVCGLVQPMTKGPFVPQ